MPKAGPERSGGPYIYTLARVSWRLDSLVSRHRRVTQTLEIVRLLLAGARGFSPLHRRDFPR
jgi:hypothetical protein